ncbi:hypothetical protein WMY93_014946 [Mugilogobius chulae]|uniref:Lysosome-associated membrane glycoprotein 2-like luminal domain-containing protein n=1 Tax=Mugilogobius chulae TaxID=88201 RepID=A0AAW0NWF1_9GOBI
MTCDAGNAAENYNGTNKDLTAFQAGLGKSYSCSKESLTVNKTQGLYLDIDQERMQVFNFANDKDFGPADPCPADRSNYRVAIAVGITLLVLVVVVVIAYFVARRKRTDGYQSL